MTRPYANPEALIRADDLLSRAGDPLFRIVEVDVDTTLYHKGHIPGAIAWDWTRDLNDPVTRDVASREQFEALLSRSGITPETTVVLYGDNNNWFAAFAAWLLNYYGHDRVRLLDGGRKRWELDGRPLTTEEPAVAATSYRVREVRADLRATRDLVLQAARAGSHALVDVRSPDEYTGKILAPPGMSETALRGGHIPGALNVPWARAVNEDGTFRSRAELEALYPLPEGRDVIAYCRIGERSSHTWFVLRHLLGHTTARNYDGSWTEYGNLIGAPIAVGPEAAPLRADASCAQAPAA